MTEPLFLPVALSTLVDHLAGDLFSDEASRRGFRDLSELTRRLMSHFASQATQPLVTFYRHVDPDCEFVAPGRAIGEAEIEEFFASFADCCDSAGFAPMAAETLVEAAESTPSVKAEVDINLAEIKRFAIFTRGTGLRATTLRPVKNLFRLTEIETATHRRVIILIQSSGAAHLSIQLYKDVVKDDIELLLPSINLKMNLLDRLKLSGTGGSSLVSAVKLARTLLLQSPKLLAVPFKALLIPVMVLVGLIYGGKTVFDYSKIKSHYLETLRKNLYSLCLAKNASALSRLTDMQAEERLKSALVAYAFLHKSGRGLSATELSSEVDRYVARHFALRLAFDGQGAIELLAELGLIESGELGRSRVSGLSVALTRIDEAWDELYQAPAAHRADESALAGGLQDPAGL
jgi:hypothetical protein